MNQQILGSWRDTCACFSPTRPRLWWWAIGVGLLVLLPDTAFAHGVTAGDKGYIQATFGTRIIPFMYLGAKHMVTGYDHLLFLLGVIFFCTDSKTSEFTSHCLQSGIR